MVDYSEAVSQGRSISFVYDGLDRVVTPTAHGLHASTGNETIRGFQTEGWTHSPGSPTPWRLFSVAKIVNPEYTGIVENQAPEGYEVGDSHISPLFADFRDGVNA